MQASKRVSLASTPGVQVKRRSEVVAIPTALGVVVKTGGQPAQVEKVAYALSHSDML